MSICIICIKVNNQIFRKKILDRNSLIWTRIIINTCWIPYYLGQYWYLLAVVCFQFTPSGDLKIDSVWNLLKYLKTKSSCWFVGSVPWFKISNFGSTPEIEKKIFFCLSTHQLILWIECLVSWNISFHSVYSTWSLLKGDNNYHLLCHAMKNTIACNW